MPTSEAESLKILNMGLPVERIMAEVEEEMLHMDEEVNEELLRMNWEPAKVEHVDELNEDLEKDLDGIAIEVGVADTFWLLIFTLNWAKKWFNSIFNSKLNLEYSFNKIIHSNWRKNQSLRKQWKTVKKNKQIYGAFFTQNALFIHF